MLDDTPADLKARAPAHGAVRARVATAAREATLKRLAALEGAERVERLAETESGLWVRIYPRPAEGGATLAPAIMRQLGQGDFGVETLYLEEGRLDEVFRMVTK